MLLELDQPPQPSFNVYYSGWDARNQIPPSSTAIHHPNADEKSISLDYDPPTITSLCEDSSPGNGLYLRVADWDEGTTEAGSSGGCLFDNATKRCVGNLSGGAAACGNDDPDWYGRMFAHWTGDGTPDTRLSDWLDPLGTDVLFVDGKNGAGVGSEEVWLIPAVASQPVRGTDRLDIAGRGSQPDLRNPFGVGLRCNRQPSVAGRASQRAAHDRSQPVAIPRRRSAARKTGLRAPLRDGQRDRDRGLLPHLYPLRPGRHLWPGPAGHSPQLRSRPQPNSSCR